jgi:acetyl esterase
MKGGTVVKTMPVERLLTARQVQQKVGFARGLLRLTATVTGARHRIKGTELFLETRAGRVRVLAYRLDEPDPLPLFVNIHGGGFVLGSPEMDDPFLPRVAERAGVKILSIDYGLAPEAPFPQALDQCYAVVRYAKERAGELGIDPERIAVGGHSAGGNLSAGICLLDAERRELGLKALVLDYPPLDLHTDAYLKPRPKKAIPPKMARLFDAAYCGTREAAKNPLISPVFADAEHLRTFPPTLMLSASEDSLAPEEAAFKDQLLAAGVPVTYKLFQGATHGFTLKKGAASDEAWQMIITHLATHLATAR